MITQYVIVLGCPRSGTTYLMSILNALPEAECMNGTLLPVTIPHVVNRPLSKEVYEALAIGFERALDDYLHSGRYHSRAAAIQKWVSAPTGARGLMRALRGERLLPHWMIYKEPALSFAPEFVLEAFRDHKIVYIYRDGRDVANSLVKTYDVLTDKKLEDLQTAEAKLGRLYGGYYIPWWVEEGKEQRFLECSPYVRAIWMWKYMVSRCHTAFHTPEVQAKGNVLLLQYEDLVQAPSSQGQRLLQHIGAEETRALHKRLAAARDSSIGKHQCRTDAEIRAAEEVAGEELRMLGYI